MDYTTVKKEKISQLIEFTEAFIGEVEREHPNVNRAKYYRNMISKRLFWLSPRKESIHQSFDLNTESVQFIEFFCEIHKLDFERITKKGTGNKKNEYVLPRQFLMWTFCEKSKLSLMQIGDLFGGRDHSTVLHAKKIVENEMSLKKNNSFAKFL